MPKVIKQSGIKLAHSKKEIINIDEILPQNSKLIFSSLNESKISVREKSKQIRLNLYHYITHAIAILIIAPYVILVALGNDVSFSYSTLVSLVIGFYFGRSLTFD